MGNSNSSQDEHHQFYTYKGNEGDDGVPRDVTRVKVKRGVDKIEESAFDDCKFLKAIIINNSTTIIDNNAFSGCSSLTHITLPYTITSIGDFAFQWCTSLQTIKLPSHIKVIGRGAFRSCTSLRKIYIPSTITYISKEAFSGCTSLSFVHLPPKIELIHSEAFVDCPSLQTIYIPLTASTYVNAFDTRTDVILLHNWYEYGHCIMLRELVVQGRAIPLALNNEEEEEVDEDDVELKIIQNLIVNECDDIFRYILEMITEQGDELSDADSSSFDL